MTFHPDFFDQTVYLTNLAIKAAICAGSKINEVYSSSVFNVRIKDDHTPVTIADYLAHAEIVDKLQSTGIPVLSEEGVHLHYNERKNWKLFWLVDPLDGTKEFIKRNDEFTVNIALIHENKPISGVIYAPVSGELFAGIPEFGAYKIINPNDACTFGEMQQAGIKLPLKVPSEKMVIAISRSHMNQETANYIDQLAMGSAEIEIQQKGSSLKICMVAEGTAVVYPKFGKTMEWDTAAGHAIIKAVGKNIICPETNTELTYNKQDLRNPNFIAG
jgi:3'(2'), 5'-bisphosphate nucleotidase